MPTYTHIAVVEGAAFSSSQGEEKWKNANDQFVAGPDTGSAVVNCNGYNIYLDSSTAAGETVEFYNDSPLTGGNTPVNIQTINTINYFGSFIFHTGCRWNISQLNSAIVSLLGNAFVDCYEAFMVDSGASLVISSLASLYIRPSVSISPYGSITFTGTMYLWGSFDCAGCNIFTGDGSVYLQSTGAYFNDYTNTSIVINNDNTNTIPPTNLVKSGTVYDGGLKEGDAPASTFLPFTSTTGKAGPWPITRDKVGPFPIV